MPTPRKPENEDTTIRVSRHVRKKLHKLHVSVMNHIAENPHLYPEYVGRVLTLSVLLEILTESAMVNLGVNGQC